MVIAAVDPNKKDLKLLVKFLRMAFPACHVLMFSDPEAAARYIQDNPVDVLYTEAAMLYMSGFELQTAAEAVQPAILTVLVTDTDTYAGQAIKSRAQGYIIKPVTKKTLQDSMSDTKFSYKK